MLIRIQRKRVPVVLVDEARRPEFAAADAELHAYLRDQYAGVAQFTLRDGSPVEIGARRDAWPLETYGPGAWPCRFVTGDEPWAEEPLGRPVGAPS